MCVIMWESILHSMQINFNLYDNSTRLTSLAFVDEDMKLRNGNNFLRFSQLISRRVGHSNPGLWSLKPRPYTPHHSASPFRFTICNTFSLYGNQRAQLNKKKIRILCNPYPEFTIYNHFDMYPYSCFPIHMCQAHRTSYMITTQQELQYRTLVEWTSVRTH